MVARETGDLGNDGDVDCSDKLDDGQGGRNFLRRGGQSTYCDESNDHIHLNECGESLCDLSRGHCTENLVDGARRDTSNETRDMVELIFEVSQQPDKRCVVE